MKAGGRYYQTARDKTVWLRADDIGVVDKPPTWPDFAEKGEKWIDVSITAQVLVLYEGKKPVYATLVSTGRDKLGDPKETLSTLRGTFRLPIGLRGVATLAAMPMIILIITMWLSYRGGDLGAKAVIGALVAAALGPLLYRFTPLARAEVS